MKQNTGAVRAHAEATRSSPGTTGQESGLRTGMVEAVDGVSVCFTCQQVGHITRFCPMLRGQAVSDGQMEAQSRREERKRKEEDRSEFFNAVSEASAKPRPSSMGAAAQIPQAEAPRKLPAFMAVKRRKQDEASAPELGNGMMEVGGEVMGVCESDSVGRELGNATPSPKQEPALAGGAKVNVGIAGLGAYGSSSSSEEEERETK